jgi:peroxiredoxin
MCAVRDHIEDYRGAGVTVWGVTGHSSVCTRTTRS